MIKGNLLNYLNICVLIYSCACMQTCRLVCVNIGVYIYIFSIHIDVPRHMCTYQY